MNITISIDDNELIGILKQVFTDAPVQKKTEPINSLLKRTQNMSLESLGFSVRAINALRCYDIRTLDKLLSCTPMFLSKIRNFGKSSLSEINSILRSHGLRLCMLPPIWTLYLYHGEAFKTDGSDYMSFKTQELAEKFIETENEKIFNQ